MSYSYLQRHANPTISVEIETEFQRAKGLRLLQNLKDYIFVLCNYIKKINFFFLNMSHSTFKILGHIFMKDFLNCGSILLSQRLGNCVVESCHVAFICVAGLDTNPLLKLMMLQHHPSLYDGY